MEFMFPIDSSLLFAILIVMTISAYILILKKLRPKSILTKNIPKEDPKKYDPQNQKKKDKNMRKKSRRLHNQKNLGQHVLITLDI